MNMNGGDLIKNKSFKNSKEVSDRNKEAVRKFVKKCKADSKVGSQRIKKYVSNLHSILKIAPKSFELLDASKEDLEEVVARTRSTDLAEWTKRDFSVVLKKFYKVMESDGKKYPKKVNFISTSMDKSKQKLPKPLEKEEIDKIIQACKNDRDRAMYKVLYEGGLRAGELMGLQIKDVKFNSNGVKLTVKGKTGGRRILLVESERYLRNWLSKHPFAKERDAPLWVKVNRNNIKEKTPKAMKIDYGYMRVNLKRKAVAAGVRVKGRTSEVYPHLFRHSRATHLATKLTEAALCAYFGWVQGSDMPRIYIHLSGKDVDKEIARMYGLKEEEKNEKRECSRCFKTYKGSESFCPRCGAPLDQRAAMKVENIREAADTIAKALLSCDLNKEKLLRIVKEVSS